MPNQLKRIFCVEDEHDIRAVTELALKAVGGFEIEVAENGADALERIPMFKPDLVLLDVMMPGLKGPDVFERLKGDAEVGHTPVVFMTARTQKREIEDFIQIGAVGVISKPFDPMTLHEHVRAIWNRVQFTQAAS